MAAVRVNSFPLAEPFVSLNLGQYLAFSVVLIKISELQSLKLYSIVIASSLGYGTYEFPLVFGIQLLVSESWFYESHNLAGCGSASRACRSGAESKSVSISTNVKLNYTRTFLKIKTLLTVNERIKQCGLPLLRIKVKKSF
jgi:hypothetical protein